MTMENVNAMFVFVSGPDAVRSQNEHVQSCRHFFLSKDNFIFVYDMHMLHESVGIF